MSHWIEENTESKTNHELETKGLPVPCHRWKVDVYEAFDYETHGRLAQDCAEL